MSLSLSLRNAANTLIDTFGNTARIYTFSTATKNESSEGSMTITQWGVTAATISSIDGDATTINVTTASANTLAVGDNIQITTTVGYNGVYVVSEITDNTHFIISDTTHDLAAEIVGSVIKLGTSAKLVDGVNVKESLSQTIQGLESLGDDEKVLRYDAVIVVNDLLVENNVNYKVTEVRPIYNQDTLIIQIIKVVKTVDSVNW